MTVIPAKAGIQCRNPGFRLRRAEEIVALRRHQYWIPAFAGMTARVRSGACARQGLMRMRSHEHPKGWPLFALASRITMRANP